MGYAARHRVSSVDPVDVYLSRLSWWGLVKELALAIRRSLTGHA